MKVLTIHQLKMREDDFCFGIEGELAFPGMVCCDSTRCGCDRAFGGLNSHRASTVLMVRNVRMRPLDLTDAYLAYLESAGWAAMFGDDEDELHRFVEETVDEVTDMASEFDVGTVVRVKYNHSYDCWDVEAA